MANDSMRVGERLIPNDGVALSERLARQFYTYLAIRTTSQPSTRLVVATCMRRTSANTHLAHHRLLRVGSGWLESPGAH